MQTANVESAAQPSELSWKDVLYGEKEKPYFKLLTEFVTEQRRSAAVYPQEKDVYNALKLTPFSKVKVVILGQDPYHGAHQAHGLSFSVLPPTKPPPSLVNIFKELATDIGMSRPDHGSLESWAHQGVLLLNSVLTVRAGTPASHAKKGWEQFTDRIIHEVAQRKERVVFLLWGAYAQKKGAFIDVKKHTVLCAPHPSPFSADSGFFGCKHFSQTNAALREAGLVEIDWKL